jgi:plastocyanin
VTRLLGASALALMLVACAGSAGDPPTGRPVRTTEVELPKSYRFEPEAIRVEVGAEVTWTNRDDFPHNVHLLDGSDVEVALPVGESASLTFDAPGTVDYECSLHPQQMQGTILVG